MNNIRCEKRASFIQNADWVGYLPIVGSGVGVLRIVASITMIAVCILGLLSEAAANCPNQERMGQQCFWIERSIGECIRGAVELIPGLSYGLDCQYKDKSTSLYAKGIHIIKTSSDIFPSYSRVVAPAQVLEQIDTCNLP